MTVCGGSTEANSVAVRRVKVALSTEGDRNSAAISEESLTGEINGLYPPVRLAYVAVNPDGPPYPAADRNSKSTHVWQERGTQVVRRFRSSGTAWG